MSNTLKGLDSKLIIKLTHETIAELKKQGSIPSSILANAKAVAMNSEFDHSPLDISSDKNNNNPNLNKGKLSQLLGNLRLPNANQEKLITDWLAEGWVEKKPKPKQEHPIAGKVGGKSKAKPSVPNRARAKPEVKKPPPVVVVKKKPRFSGQS